MFFKKKTPLEKLRHDLQKQHLLSEIRKSQKETLNHKLAVMIMFGVMVIFFTGQCYYKETYVYSQWVETTAQILHIRPFQKSTLRGSKDYYSLTISYVANNQNRIVTKELRGTPKKSVGSNTPIKFNPSNLDQYRFNDGDDSVFIAFMLILGLTMIAFPGLLLFRKDGTGKPKSWRKPLFFIGLLLLVTPFIFGSTDTPWILTFLTGLILALCCLALIIKDLIYTKMTKTKTESKANILKDTQIPDRSTVVRKR